MYYHLQTTVSFHVTLRLTGDRPAKTERFKQKNRLPCFLLAATHFSFHPLWKTEKKTPLKPRNYVSVSL